MNRHMDCRNFAALDVVKGVCHRTKETVPADAEHCEHFTPVPKCRLCSHFAAGEEHLGSCNAVPRRPMTYPDLIAVTCGNFKAHG
jgi:4-hydroxyphenylacetate decarboxylase small subunit